MAPSASRLVKGEKVLIERFSAVEISLAQRVECVFQIAQAQPSGIVEHAQRSHNRQPTKLRGFTSVLVINQQRIGTEFQGKGDGFLLAGVEIVKRAVNWVETARTSSQAGGEAASTLIPAGVLGRLISYSTLCGMTMFPNKAGRRWDWPMRVR